MSPEIKQFIVLRKSNEKLRVIARQVRSTAKVIFAIFFCRDYPSYLRRAKHRHQSSWSIAMELVYEIFMRAFVIADFKNDCCITITFPRTEQRTLLIWLDLQASIYCSFRYNLLTCHSASIRYCLKIKVHQHGAGSVIEIIFDAVNSAL